MDTGKSRSFSILRLLRYLLYLLLALFRGKKKDDDIPSVPQEDEWKKYLDLRKDYSHLSGDGSDQLIVMRKDGSDDLAFTNWLKKITAQIEASGGDPDKVKIVSICGNCDNSLLLLSGEGIETFIKTEAAKKGTERQRQTAVEGEDEVVYFSSNLKMNLPGSKRRPLKDDSYKSIGRKPLTNLHPTINVAVFDTGLAEGEMDQFIIDPVQSPCIPGALKGWNFTVPDQHFQDDNPGFHGSLVSRFIIDQTVAESGNPIRIIPVKVHNQNGKSDLYSILCGFAYAKKQGAHIINASFGYYAPLAADEEYCIALFRNFIKEHLAKAGILLIAAAGNEASSEEIEADFRTLYPVPSDDQIRNLDFIGFYPASFSTDPELKNVIAVTTVNRNMDKVSPAQNYSPSVVDIGVPADETKGFGFINPRTQNNFIYGSSFATPILTGIIATNYWRFSANPDKDSVITDLQSAGLITVKDELKPFVREGRVLVRGLQ